MNHPYMYPDQCPWLDDYEELKDAQASHTFDLYGSSRRSKWREDDDNDDSEVI